MLTANINYYFIYFMINYQIYNKSYKEYRIIMEKLKQLKYFYVKFQILKESSIIYKSHNSKQFNSHAIKAWKLKFPSFEVRIIKFQILRAYIIPPIPPIPPISGIAGIAGLSSLISLTVASVVSSKLATLTAF